MHIKVRRNGAMSVEGCIHEKDYALKMLDAARDSINSHHKRINGGGIVIPRVLS